MPEPKSRDLPLVDAPETAHHVRQVLAFSRQKSSVDLALRFQLCQGGSGVRQRAAGRRTWCRVTVVKRCPHCGATCLPSHRHCPSCGADISQVEMQEGDTFVGLTLVG